MPQPLIPPATAAARARAAISYSGSDHKAIADKTGLSIAVIRRMTSKSKPRDATIERLWAIADACDVPRWFMEHGYEPPADVAATTKIEQRLADLEARDTTQLDRLEAQIVTMLEAVIAIDPVAGEKALEILNAPATSQPEDRAAAVTFPPVGEEPELQPAASDSTDQDDASTGMG